MGGYAGDSSMPCHLFIHDLEAGQGMISSAGIVGSLGGDDDGRTVSRNGVGRRERRRRRGAATGGGAASG